MNKTLLFCAMALSIPAADAATLLPAGSADMSPARLVALPAPQGAFERQPVSYAWALDPYAELAEAAPFVAESRDFFLVADAADLRKGLPIVTTAPGAVIRLSPVGAVAKVDPGEVRLLKGGRLIPHPQSFKRANDAAQLQAAGMDIPDGSAVLQIADSHGQGRFEVQLPKAGGRYLVHVFEPGSDIVLKAQAGRTAVLAGDTLEVAAVMQRGRTKLGGGELEGELVAPDGQRHPLSFRDGVARTQAPLASSDAPGLWEVQLFAGRVIDGLPVQREARTVVEIVRPTARLAGDYAFNASARRFELPVQVASPGRYELRGTLFATAADGVARPVAQAHSAAWMEPGVGNLVLGFGTTSLPAGYGAPYELRFVELKDQARMGTLDTRALAAREAASPRPVPGREPSNPRPAPERDRLAER